MSTDRGKPAAARVPPPHLHAFADPAELARALAGRVADELAAAIHARGRALLAVSGGRTPARFLAELSKARLGWGAVDVTLADERWVPPDDERSNERLLRCHLLVGAAAAARFVPLWRAGLAPESAAAALELEFAARLPFDVLVLGMGDDGHTASLFPGGDHLEAALAPRGARRLLPMRAPGVPEARISFTLPALAAARSLHLHIEGEAKQAVLRDALRDGELPIARVLAARDRPVELWACPLEDPARLSRAGPGVA